MNVSFEQPFTPARQTGTSSCGTITVVDDTDSDPDPDPGNGDDGNGDDGDDQLPDLSQVPGGAAGVVALVVVLVLLYFSTR